MAETIKEGKIVDWSQRFKEGEYQLNRNDLFDRVINLRLATSEVGSDGVAKTKDVYVIRSDYEFYDPAFVKNVAEGKLTYGSAYYDNSQEDTRASYQCIRKCRIKPSIKVQYRQQTGNTALEIDLYVSNFFMLSKDGKTLMSFNAVNNPLSSVEIQMGYFGAFSDFYKGNENGVPTKEQFFDFTQRPEGVEVIQCGVQFCQTDKLPPDSVLHIHGYVGSCYTSPVTEKMITGNDITLNTLDTDSVYLYEQAGYKFKNFAHYLFNNITRRFLRRVLPDISKSLKSLKLKTKDDGLCLDDDSALSYGVRIFLSEGLVGDGQNDTFLGKTVIKDSEGNPVPDKQSSVFVKALSGNTVMKAINQAISTINSEIRVSPLLNGDYYMYLNGELKDTKTLTQQKWYTYNPKLEGKGADLNGDNTISPNEVGLEKVSWLEIQQYVSACLKGESNIDVLEYKKKADKAKAEGIQFYNLPVVYNIAFDKGLCTIVCPFMHFINPFMKLRYRSRYALGGLVDYYVDAGGQAQEFTAMWFDVTFATVENINECQIVCVAEVEK